jgi:tetratricopeptide (TPR) repeat protein
MRLTIDIMNSKYPLKSIIFLLLVFFTFELMAQKTALEFKEIGIKQYKEKQYVKAIEAFTKTIELDSTKTKTDALIYRGIAHDAMNNFGLAIADFNMALSIDSNDVFLYVERAKTFYNIRNHDGAVKDFLKVTELNPNSKDAEEAWRFLGKIKQGDKDYKTAVNYYTRVLRFAPKDYETIYKRGECKFFLNDYKASIKDFDLCIEISSEYQYAFALRGEAKLKTEDKAGACKDFNTAYKLGVRDILGLINENCKK